MTHIILYYPNKIKKFRHSFRFRKPQKMKNKLQTKIKEMQAHPLVSQPELNPDRSKLQLKNRRKKKKKKKTQNQRQKYVKER